MNQLTPQTFIEIWKQFFTNNLTPETLKKKYNNDHCWTQFTLGSKSNTPEEGKFPQFLLDQLNGKGKEAPYRIRKEDGLFDLALSKHDNFTGVRDFHETEDKDGNKGNPLKTFANDDIFYPTQYDLLLEHENNILLCYEEMAKLTYARAKLKVLVTYDWDKEEWKKDGKSSDSLERLIHNFSAVIRQANEGFKENEKTRYLLLLGWKSGNELKWEHRVFDSARGEQIACGKSCFP